MTFVRNALLLALVACCSIQLSADFIKPAQESVMHRISMQSADLSVAEYFADREMLGHHLVVDFFGCNPEKIKEVATVEKIMVDAALAAKATIVARKFHQFTPTGVSGAVILAESHLALHSWPEVDGYCAVDIFTCGDTDNFAALEVLKKGFEARGYVVVEIERGKQRLVQAGCEDQTVLFQENLDPLGGFKTTIAVDSLLERVDSDFQKIEVFAAKAKDIGYVLVIDGVIQLTSFDNAAYHEMIVHVPMQAHPNPRKVLIIGGGDGGALAELNKYKDVEEIVICDIDPMVAQVAGKYFPNFADAYRDPRVRAVHQDGALFVANFKDYFDVIIVDCTDFYGVAAPFARQDFYNSIANALTADGVMVIQGESMYFDRNFIGQLHKQVKTALPLASYYTVAVPTYPSGTIGFVYGSKKYAPTEQLGQNKQILDDLFYYSQDVHRASFVLPAFLQKHLQ